MGERDRPWRWNPRVTVRHAALNSEAQVKDGEVTPSVEERHAHQRRHSCAVASQVLLVTPAAKLLVGSGSASGLFRCVHPVPDGLLENWRRRWLEPLPVSEVSGPGENRD